MNLLSDKTLKKNNGTYLSRATDSTAHAAVAAASLGAGKTLTVSKTP
jgi:hypothetical protein